MSIKKLLPLVLITTLLFYFMYNKSKYIEFIDYKIYDLHSKYFDKRDLNSLTPSVVIVDIDEKSVESVGQWPWSRIIDAQLIKKIDSFHPASIGLDILFDQADKSSIVSIEKFYKNYLDTNINISGIDNNLRDNDKIIADAISHSNSILAIYMKDRFNGKGICDIDKTNSFILRDAKTTYRASCALCSIPQIHKASKSFGFVNTKIDEDAIIRRIPLFIQYKDNIIPSFSLANLLFIDKDIKFLDNNNISLHGYEFNTDKQSQVLLHFYNSSWYKHISAIDILENSVSPEAFTGKIVLVGTTLVGQNDIHTVTTRENLYGIDIHATFIENIINKDLIYQPMILKHINFALSFFIALITILMLQKKSYFKLITLILSVLVISLIVSIVSFYTNIYISLAYLWVPLLAYFFILGIVLLYMYDSDRRIFFKELSRSHTAALESMVTVAETKDFETGAHLIRTKEYIKLLAQHLKDRGLYKDILSNHYVELVYRASPLHDIGKVGIPDDILKKPGKLSNSEYKIMQNHPTLGMKIISNAMKSYSENDFLKVAYNIAYYHHESWDGKGYPLGLKGEEIPLEARLMSIVDIYDALISKRCYKEAYSFKKAEDIIINNSKGRFDPYVLESFIELKDKFREIALNNH